MRKSSRKLQKNCIGGRRFFDQEGIGLHYRSQEISKDAKQLDIYLTKEQTQQVLKVDIYQNMF